MSEELKDLGAQSTTEATQTTASKGKFGVSKETAGGSIVPLPAPIVIDKPNEQFKTGYEFPVCNLVSVAFDPKKEMKGQGGVKEEKPVLIFVFKDNKNRQVTHLEFPINDTDARFTDKMEWMNQRIKHIWDEAIGDRLFPEAGLGANANDFSEFFEDVARQFNKIKSGEGETAKLVYPVRPLYIKLVYNGSRVQLPLFPNFLQRASDGEKKLPVIALNIDPSRDKVKPATKAGASNYGGGTDASFGEASAYNVGDFPDV